VSATLTAPSAHSHGTPVVDRGERFTSLDPAAFGVPNGREEDWRFTPLARLRGLHDGSATANDRPQNAAAVSVTAPSGVEVTTQGRLAPDLGRQIAPADVVAATAWQGFSDATVVRVPSGVQVDDPVKVVVRGRDVDDVSFGHLLVEVGPHARATVVVDYLGTGVYADNLEIRLADGAQLTLVSLQAWDDDAVHVSGHHLHVGRDAQLTEVVVTLGGDLVRIAPTVTFDGPGAQAKLYGLFFTDPGQHHEHRLFVDHAQPHCISDVNYKGALQGDGAHSVWIGDVLIRAVAVGTQTYEINRNLLLTDGPRADSVPNLEIETGDVVSAGHASATGRFDADQLFYLMARGIPEIEARRLVVRGFFADLASRIGVPEVEARIHEALEAELERTLA
jgi:Fe-S cluster assembly protein SufD